MKSTAPTSPQEFSDTTGLAPHVIERITEVMRRHPAVDQAILYGSRAKGNWRPASDIDLVLYAEALDWNGFLRLEQEIDDLLLPWKVDLSLYHQIENPALKEHIQRAGIPFYMGASTP